MRKFHAGVSARLLSVLMSLALALPALVAAGALTAAPAGAAEPPVIAIAKDGPSQILVGDTATYTLTATNPSGTGQVPQYNLSFRDVLPKGVVYEGPTTPASAGDPTIITHPTTGVQTLIWTNIADLQLNSSAGLDFVVKALEDPLPVASGFTNSADAYTHSDPRFVPKFDATGVPVPSSFTSSDTATTGSTDITAFTIDKASAPSPEGELLRGIHDHVATYTLEVTNNPSFATNAIEIRDYLPAGLEFLGCGGVDNSTATALYPDGREYPNAPSLTGTPVLAPCNVPVSVETVLNPAPDAGRVFPAGVYTKVTWTVGDLGTGETATITYRAGIPQRANSMDWQGGPVPDPSGTVGTQPKQTANLDNNTGASTRETSDERELTNTAVGDGRYTGPVQGQTGDGPFENDVQSSTDHTVTAEDLDLQKSVAPATFVAEEIATYTLTLHTSQYVTAAGIVITDVLPNGVCPLSGDPAVNYLTGATSPSECDGVAGQGPRIDGVPVTYKSVTQNPDGTFTMVFPAIPSAEANATLTIEYGARMRTQYTGGALVGQPTSSGDIYTNTVALTGETRSRPEVNAPDPSGTLTVNDDSSATQSSTQPTIDKRIKPNVSGDRGYQCAEGTTASGRGLPDPGSPVSLDGAKEYVDPATVTPELTADQISFRKGSRVCFLLRVEFPGQAQTRNPVVSDFLPAGTSYEPSSAVTTANSTLTGADVDFSLDSAGNPVWRVGQPDAGNRFAPKASVFEVVLSVLVEDAAAGPKPDVVGNLMKFRSENSAGQAISLRDQLDFQVAPLPPVSLVKGISRITPAVPPASPAPPTEDVNAPGEDPKNIDGRTVRDGDVVKFRIDVTNTSDPDLALPYRSSVRSLDLWDLLPAGIPCTSVKNPDPATGPPAVTFTCLNPGELGYPASITTNRSVLRWAFDDSDGQAIAPGDRKTLTYDFTVPRNVSVATVLTDNAGVRSYQAFTNLPGQAATYYPTNNIDPDACGRDAQPECDAPRADDPSDVVVANVALTKTGTTSITDDGNNTPDQATIGEVVTYTVTATVPYGTSVYQGGLSDTLPAGLAYESATADYSTDGGANWSATLPADTVLVNTGQLVTLTLPTSYTAAATATANHVFRLVITARVDTVNENAHGVVRTNTASFLSKASAAADAPEVTRPPDVTYPVTVVDPSPALTKSANKSSVSAGEEVTYTLTATNSAGRPPLHDSWVVDCLPAGIDFKQYVLPNDRVDVLPTQVGDGSNGCVTTETRLAWRVTSPDPTAPPAVLPRGTLLAGPANAVTLQYIATVSSTSAGLTDYTNKALLTGGTLNDAAAGPQDTPNPLERTYAAPAAATITVRGAGTTKTVSPAGATVGQTATWTIRVVVPPDVNFYRAAVIDEVLPGIDISTIGADSVQCVTVAPNPTCSVGSGRLANATPGPKGGTRIGWYLGDLQAVGYSREVVVTYSGKVANVVGPPLSPLRGNALLDYASGRWFIDANAPVPTSAGDPFPRTTNEAPATVTVQEPLVTITKAVTDTTPDPGQEFTYTVRATNSSAANISTAYNVVVKDVVPVGVIVTPGSVSDAGTFTPLPAPADPALGGGTITWPAIASIAKGASREFTYKATLAPSASLTAAGKANTASVTGYNSLADNTGRQYAGPSATRTVTPQFPKITPSKSTPNGSVAYVNEPFTWQVTLTNTGASRAFGVDALDTLPKNWEFTAMSSVVVAGTALATPPPPVLGTTGSGNQTLTWTNLGAINPNQTIVLTFTATPQTGALTDPGAGASIAHTNTVSTTAEDATGSQSSGAGPYNAGPATAVAQIHRTDLVLDKDHVGIPVAGKPFDWTIKVTNNGPDPAVGPFTVTDTVAAPMTFADASGEGWNCSAVAAALTCTRTNTTESLSKGDSFPLITLQATIPSDTPLPTTLTNSATVTGRTYDPDLTNNTDPDTAMLTALADLAIVKARSGPLEAGRSVTYTLDVSNLGPSTSRSAITVTDAVPAGTTFVSASGTGWACPEDNASITTITCIRSTDLLAGQAAPQLAVVLEIGSGFGGDLENTAVVAGTTPDPVSSNDKSSVKATVTTLADVAIEKTHAGTTDPGFDGDFTPGTNDNSYLFTVTNFGPADAAAPVIVEDLLPEHLSFTGAKVDISGAWTCVADPATTPTAPDRQKVTCTLTGGLVLGQARAVRIQVAVATSAAADGEFVNTATVTSGTTDPKEENNSSTDNTAFDSSADLAIAKTPRTQTLLAGTGVSWELTVTNSGPSNAVGPTTVVDLLPEGTTFVSASGTGWVCPADNTTISTITCEHPDGVASSGALPIITVRATVAPSAGPATLVNRASVDGPTGDPDPTNNSTEASVTVLDEADLDIVKTFTGTNPVPAGATTTFSLAVSNNGPSDADNIIVGDILPAGVALVTAVGDGWTCETAGQVLSCARATLSTKSNAPVITLTVRVDSGYQPGTIENTARVSADTQDRNEENDSSTAQFDVSASADLVLVKSHDKEATPVAGQPFRFDLDVRNAGPSDAQPKVVVTDALPVGLSYVSNGSGWTCTTSGTPALDEVVECTVDGDDPLIAGAAAPRLTLTTLIAADADPGEVTNIAEATSDTRDPETDNNTGTDTIDITTLADLVVTKAHTGPVAVGKEVEFTLGVSNDGPSEARSVTMVDTLPEGLSYVSATGADWLCEPAGQVVTCALTGPLGPKASAPSITLRVTVGPQAYPEAANVVVGQTSTPERTSDNNRATDLVRVPPLVDLALAKAHLGDFTVGAQGTYTLTVTNNGPTSDPGPQTITDTLPTGLTYVSATGTDWTCDAAGQVLTCTRSADLAVGARTEIELAMLVGPAAAPSVVNTATVSTPSAETTTDNNTATDPTTVIPVSILEIDKEVIDTDDDLVTYEITVLNTGPNATTAPIVVTDPLPAGLRFVAVSGPGWSCTEGQIVTCTYGASLAVDQSAAFELTARITADQGTEVVNVASLDGGEGGAVVSDDAAVVSPESDPIPGGAGGGSDLATTGADVGLVAWALALILGGWFAVGLSRRRRFR
ncbi:MAG: isopeptide-forming domain-containing fimbrial protein [Candidatus Nanopelagicales bacterium]